MKPLARLLVILTLTLIPAAASAQSIGWTVPLGTNIISVGARGTSLVGDSARYERYRDLADGLFLEAIRWDVQRNDWLFSLKGDHTFYKDQRYVGRAERQGRIKAWFLWDQVPMLMSNTTQTLFREDFSTEPNLFTIDPAIRAQVQATPGSSPNTAIVPSLFDANARTFETAGRRNVAQTGAEWIATQDLWVRAVYQYTNKQGVIPYGGSFGHSSLVEFPAPIAHVTNDVDTSAEWSRDRLLLRAGYTGSWFHNANTTATFDNPFRTFNSNPTSCTPAPGVSGLCSGSPAIGSVSLPPSNNFLTVNGLASYRLAARTRVTFYLSGGMLNDAGDAMMPQTVNPLNTGVLTPLDRTTVDGQARTFSTNLNFVSRPSRYFDISARFRTYDYDNQTPEFAMTQRVSYDNAPGIASMSTLGGVGVPYTTSPIHTEPFGVSRQALDLDFRATPWSSMMVFGVGYTRLGEQRNHRLIEDTTDHIVRVTFDAIGNRWFTLRTKYEHAERNGDASLEAQEELFGIGEHPEIRHFDIASRSRDRVTVLASTTPFTNVSFYGSASYGTDDYDTIKNQFGLLDNSHQIFTVGADLTPWDNIALGASYSYEYYNALSRSRQANPPSPTITYAQYLLLSQGPTTVQIADASRNWASDGTDRVHSVILYGEVMNLWNRVDVHFTYDMNRANAAYNYVTGPIADRTLPDDAPPTTLTNCNQPDNCKLPLVTNDLDRATTDLTYWLNRRVGFGGSYWYERYFVTDWALDAEATSREVLSQAMILGYNYRPYTAHSFFARLLLRW